MLGLELTTPVIARRRRGASAPPVIFPGDAYGYWEGQGQSNMTGFNQISAVPATLRVVNPGIEMMTDAPGWRPYALLDVGESETVDGVLYEGKLDEVEIPPAAGGAGPLIGLHEAMRNGDMDGPGGLLPAGLLMGKFSASGKHLREFLPDHDDGSPPLGGTLFNTRNTHFPASLGARLAAGDTIYAQGKIWFHGEANAAAARAAGDPGAADIADYAAGFARIRAFQRGQLQTPALPYYLCAIAANDAYDAAINAALASLCRWRVLADGGVVDLGPGRDGTSYFIDHGIDTGGDVHFTMAQMRAIGALVWTAHRHHAGNPHGLTIAHPVAAIIPQHQRPPAVTSTAHDRIAVDAVLNEDGALYGLVAPAGAPAPAAGDVVAGGISAAALTFTGLAAETAYDIHLAFVAASGDLAEAKTVSAATGAAPAAGWTPAEAGALHWFDAQDAATLTEAGGEITAWTDKSPAAAVLTPSDAGARPALAPLGLNGLPAVDFDGEDDLEGAIVSLAPDMCLVIVAQVDLPVNGSESLIDYKAQNLKIRANNTAEFRARLELQNGANTFINPSPVTDYGAAPHIFLCRFDAAADRIEYWIDGVLVGAGDSYVVDLAASDELRLMRPFGSALKLDGRIGEVAAIASSAPADRARLEGYAAHRWGLAGLLPADHPWKDAAP